MHLMCLEISRECLTKRPRIFAIRVLRFGFFLVRHISFICILTVSMDLFFSGLYSRSLGYVREFLLLFLHWFPLNLVILRVDFAVFWV
jgi:hypothetical protein